MARLIDQDFARLEIFLGQYTLADLLSSKTREQLIKRGHKFCLAALQVWAIAENLINNGNPVINGVKVEKGSVHLEQLSESFSDITSSLFAALHGVYKPAHMSLRSAIETFTRSIAGIYSEEAAKTTNVNRLFELAQACPPFQGRATSEFDSLRQQYRQLCGFAHTATPAHMIKNHAMSSFPRQDINHLRVWVRHFEITIGAILSILVFSNRNLYLLATPSAQDVYEEVIPKRARLFVLGHPGS